MTLPILLALGATLASTPDAGDAGSAQPAASQANGPGPTTVSVETISREVLAPADPSRSDSARSGRAKSGPAQYALLEGIFLVWSALAASEPEATGWAAVGLSPLSFMNLQPDDTVEGATFFAVGMAGIGLSNALELRSERYSYGRRLLLNLAAWNAVAVATEITSKLTRKRRTGAAVALGVVPRGDGALLLLRGGF